MKIKELAKEHFCSTEFNDGTVHECYEFSEVELAKFAEQIVQDCVNTLHNNGYDDAAVELQKHFKE
jgi:hypothetical protein